MGSPMDWSLRSVQVMLRSSTRWIVDESRLDLYLHAVYFLSVSQIRAIRYQNQQLPPSLQDNILYYCTTRTLLTRDLSGCLV